MDFIYVRLLNYHNTNNYYSNNTNNYANDSPYNPAQASASGGLGNNSGLNNQPASSHNQPESSNNQGKNNRSRHPGMMPGVQSPGFENGSSPDNSNNDDPYLLSGNHPAGGGFPRNNFDTTTYQKDNPKKEKTPFTGLPNGFMPLRSPNFSTNQTAVNVNSNGNVTPSTEDERRNPENPSSYDLGQQMGQCCLSLGSQNVTNSQKIDNTNNKLDALNAELNIGETGGITAILNKLKAMDAWLITKFAALWSHRDVDRALAVLNIALGIHNAIMFSNKIATTLGAALGH